MSSNELSDTTSETATAGSPATSYGERSRPADVPEWELISRSTDPLLSVENLRTEFRTPRGTVHAVNGVSFEIEAGEILGVVGESGCGKSVTARSIMGLIRSPGEITDGEIRFKDRNLLDLSASERRRVRGNEMSMVFQEPMNALNPVYDVGWQLAEPLRVHRGMGRREARERAMELMDTVGIPSPEDRVDDYPHQFSGGMRQRAMIAMALACYPDLIIADEPTTALDVTIEAQILNLIEKLNDENGMSVLLITHNLGVVAEICDRVAVMYAGNVVEYADVEMIFEDPRHPYTKGLLNCIPNLYEKEETLTPIGGQVPDPRNLPSGCNFHNRCPYAIDVCRDVNPELREVETDHYSACIWEDPR